LVLAEQVLLLERKKVSQEQVLFSAQFQHLAAVAVAAMTVALDLMEDLAAVADKIIVEQLLAEVATAELTLLLRGTMAELAQIHPVVAVAELALQAKILLLQAKVVLEDLEQHHPYQDLM
jgi:hypothetical protein